MNLHLTEKAGPLKVWQWLALVTLALLGWRVLAARKSSARSSTSSTTATSTTPVGVPPVVVNTFGGSGQYGASGPTTSSPTPPAAPQPTRNPYQVAVSDQADEAIALSAGIPKSWLVYAGSDPYAGKPNALQQGWVQPSDLPMLDPAGATPVYVGLANQVAPAGAQKVFGQNRQQTTEAVKQWSQHYVMGQG